MIIRKSYFYFALIVVLLVGVGFFFLKSGDKNVNGDVVGSKTGDVQNVVLGIKNANYYPNTITVKVNVPVKLTLDSSVTGCLRTFTIKDLGVRGSSMNPSQTIDFTPNKKGTFRFACSMGMGFGTIIVE